MYAYGHMETVSKLCYMFSIKSTTKSASTGRVGNKEFTKRTPLQKYMHTDTAYIHSLLYVYLQRFSYTHMHIHIYVQERFTKLLFLQNNFFKKICNSYF